MSRLVNNSLFLVFLLLFGCAKPEQINSTSTSLNPQACSKTLTATGAGSSGSGYVFNPDPIVSSGNAALSPTSTALDSYRFSGTLSHLTGVGVLAGTLVSVGNGITCNGNYNAFSSTNQFNYSHSEAEFQEVAAYYWGDAVRSKLSTAGYLQPTSSLKIVAHCMNDDNAYYSREIDGFSNITQSVCLGDSVQTPGAYYADDGQVTMHEVQHGATVNTYSLSQQLNQFWYDEAGSINEGVSDFMALMVTDALNLVSNTLDPRIFSRWALGTFLSSNQKRGAHQCPEYDGGFKNCTHFNADPSVGFSAENNHVSYAYPDGLGWPYAKVSGYLGPEYLKSVFTNFYYQEEIHNNGSIIDGALWDVYQALTAGRTDDEAATLTTKVLMEAIKHLPLPTGSNHSPVTMPRLGTEIVNAATLLGFSNTDKTAITNALTARGLVNTAQVSAGWAAVGTGVSGTTAGLKVKDDPAVLKSWLSSMGSNSAIVTQSGANSTNGKADRGEVVALWFDIQNNSANTAGGVLVTVSSPDTDITFLDSNYNVGALNSSSAQIMYSKINGTSVVTALTDGTVGHGTLGYNLSTSNTYFKTNPKFSSTFMTAIFAKIASGATTGTKNLTVTLTPANGATQVLTFPITIY